MPVYIRVNIEGRVVCRATELCNMHGDGADFIMGEEALPGDYVINKQVIKHPENYPGPSRAKRDEALIVERMRKIAKDQLVAEGKIINEHLIAK